MAFVDGTYSSVFTGCVACRIWADWAEI